MQIDLIPTLIEQFRENFEGEITSGQCWITDGPPASSVFGTIVPLNADQAFAPPAPGARSVAGHVAHLHFALVLTLKRLNGDNPPADWSKSFDVPPASDDAWKALQRDLRKAYDGVVTFLETHRANPIDQWPPLNVVGMTAMTAHNAYHLGAIRQIIRAQK